MGRFDPLLCYTRTVITVLGAQVEERIYVIAALPSVPFLIVVAAPFTARTKAEALMWMEQERIWQRGHVIGKHMYNRFSLISIESLYHTTVLLQLYLHIDYITDKDRKHWHPDRAHFFGSTVAAARL